MKYSYSFSWFLFCLAILLWVAVGYVAERTFSLEVVREISAGKREQELSQQEDNLHIHALARETKDSRAKLDEIARSDVVEILDSIESIARSSGLPISIGQAITTSTTADSTLHAVSLSLEATGSFAEVTHAAALLESLPIPSSLREIRFEQISGNVPGKKGKMWRVTAQVQFLTSADISS